MNETPDISASYETGQSKPNPVNVKRILSRVIRFWYLMVLSAIISLTIAFLVNRYTTRIYPVKASILIKENEESVGAKFLYNNELVNPYRNFYNEIYIMKSYPLLEQVVESLGFTISFHREGDIKTTEYYNPKFPVKFHLVPASRSGSKAFRFEILSESSYSVSYEGMERAQDAASTTFSFGDTVRVNGSRMVVQKLDSVSDYINQRYLVTIRDPLQLAKAYSSKLKVTWAEQGASVVNLEVQGAVIQKEVDFLNRFIERYQQYDIEKKTRVSIMAMRFLDDQLSIIGDSLKLYEDQVVAFKRRNIITNLGQETNRLYQRMLSMDDQKFQHKLQDNYYAYISQLLKADNYDGIFTPASVGVDDPAMASLINELIAEQAQIKLYKNSSERGAVRAQDNPTLQSKLQTVAIIKQNILKTIENSRATQEINNRFIGEQIKLIEAQLRKLPATERELISIQRNYSLRENLYVFLLQKRTEAGLSEASTTSDIVVVNLPMAGGSITPQSSMNYGIGLLVGLAIPLLLFVGAELLNDRIQSREDIEQYTRAPVIGGVGHNPELESMVVVNRPRSAMAESFRALRSNLNYFTSGKDHQVFMVTSSIPGEGKSFTTLNLASVFAMSGKRTLVVGADLRKPKLYEELDLHNDVGLSQYLSGMADQKAITQQSSIENLFLISGGAMPPNPSELLLKPAMRELIESLRNEFDCIILDTPPLGLVTDAFVLASLVNHTLFVVRQDYTPRQVLQALEEYYSNGKLSNVSILFNDLRKTGLGYGYGNYGYHYGYGYGYNYGYGYGGKGKSDYYTD